MRPRALSRYKPFLERHGDGSRDHLGSGLVLFREVLDQVGRHRRQLIVRYWDALVDHHAQDSVPALRVVAVADAAEEGVATIAIGRDQILAIALGQFLARSRERRADQGSSQQ